MAITTTTTQNGQSNNNSSKNEEFHKECALTTCGHYCSLCPPVLQQLLLLSQKCRTKNNTIPVRSKTQKKKQ
jgi:hypothetical protein